MDIATHCAYNLTRKVSLSERVSTVSSIHTSAQLLAVVLNGPGRDPASAVWLTEAGNVSEMPRLFAFDLAYLDNESRIIQAAAVGPATPFPPLFEGVASILFLADGCLVRSGTVTGDIVKFCTESELLALKQKASWPDQVADPPQLTDTFKVHSRPQNLEPFSASLIYLPSSGSPQASEIFLRPETPLPSESNPPIADMVEAVQLNSTGMAPEHSAHIAPENIDPIPESMGHRTRDDEPDIQLPPSLRSVIELVDEQLRREGFRPPVRPQNAAEVKSDIEKVKPSEQTYQEPSEQIRDESQSEAIITSPAPAPSEESNALPDLPVEPAVSGHIPVHSSEELESLSHPATAPEQTMLPRPAPEPKAIPLADQIQIYDTVDTSTATKPARPKSPARPQPSKPERTREIERAIVSRAKEKIPFATRVQRWLAGESVSLNGNRRRGERVALPGLVAFYWTGGAPKPYEIVNISTSGLYLRSREMWSPDTIVRMTLERPNEEKEERESISVLARVVRSDAFGVAHEFVMTDVLEKLRVRDLLPEHGTNRQQLEKFLAPHQ